MRADERWQGQRYRLARSPSTEKMWGALTAYTMSAYLAHPLRGRHLILEDIRVTPTTFVEGDTVEVNGHVGVVVTPRGGPPTGTVGVVVTRRGSPPKAIVDSKPLCTGNDCLSVLEYTRSGWTCQRCRRIASLASLREYCMNRKAWIVVANQQGQSVAPDFVNDHLPPGAAPFLAAATLLRAALPTRVIHLPRQYGPGPVMQGIIRGPEIDKFVLGPVFVLDPPAKIAATPPTCASNCASLLQHDDKNWICREHGVQDTPHYNIERYLRPLDWPFAARVTPEAFCSTCARPFNLWHLAGQSRARCRCPFDCDLNLLAKYLAQAGSVMVQGCDGEPLVSRTRLLQSASSPVCKAITWALRNLGDTLTLPQCRDAANELIARGEIT